MKCQWQAAGHGEMDRKLVSKARKTTRPSTEPLVFSVSFLCRNSAMSTNNYYQSYLCFD